MLARNFGIFGLACATLFAGLLAIKTGWFASSPTFPDPATSNAPTASPPASGRDVWINIRQNGRKIGFGHETLTPTDTGLDLSQRIQMRLKTLGLIQEIRMQTQASLSRDYSLRTFRFGLQSGSFRTRIEGEVAQEGLRLTTTTDGEARQTILPIKPPLYLPAGVTAALGSHPADPGDEAPYPVFDPATLGRATLMARYLGPETITLDGQPRQARHWRIAFKGATQSVWLSAEGEVLKEEGILGISLERTTREAALSPAEAAPSDDLIQLAAISPDRPIDAAKSRHRLRVVLTGLPPDYPSLSGGRQSWDGRQLTIVREDAPDSGLLSEPDPQAADLSPAPLIESDHPRIIELARRLAEPGDSPRTRVKKIMAWLADHIERRPVVSVPSALNTLAQGRGDCNEHAVLFAALARAMDVPAQVEAGIVYMEGRFYYHAWNRVYLGEWVTVDTIFQQLPADVTHIRLARGAHADQLNLLGAIGRLRVKVMEDAS